MERQFNGDRLKKARIYRGMTVKELADASGCQRQTLSMYEISKSQPSDSGVVDKLADILNFPVGYFYENGNVDNKGTVYFRSLLTTNKKYRTEQIIKMEFLSQVYSLLEDYIQFPEVKLLPNNIEHTPESAAKELRRLWGLGNEPIKDIVTEVEKHGLLVTTFDTSTSDIDAFSQFVSTSSEPTFLIAYSNNKTSAARIHFDIAHELGHICLHDWSDDIEELTKEEFKEREQQAHEFAAAFLLPEESFKRDAMSTPQTIAGYRNLKKKWRVSIAAMIRRASQLGVIPYTKYQDMIRVMQRRGIRKEEPLDDVLITAGPALLKTSVMILLHEKVFTPQEFMEELSDEYGLSIYPEDVEDLLDLPKGTLAPDKTINFPTLWVKKEK